ncbi:5-formyltetrahydrofolate cyclo-ligase [Archaeoglobales archaeon ex4484_92]|nr:MAG: 5-formyltetrahydrofolate cyclo-ligase [Archaeoglobales archaeon ex4484_92]
MFSSKEHLRNYIWEKLDGICFPKPYGRIPNFFGAWRACSKIRNLDTYNSSNFFFSAPDGVLFRLREIILEDGKSLLVALPKMSEFRLLDKYIKPSIRIMAKFGKRVKLSDLDRKLDFFVQGCVAVDLLGNRIGKGSGFGDKEYKILRENKLINDDTLCIVVAHDVQVFDDFSYLCESHDVKVDVILTPTRIVWTENYKERF